MTFQSESDSTRKDSTEASAWLVVFKLEVLMATHAEAASWDEYLWPEARDHPSLALDAASDEQQLAEVVTALATVDIQQFIELLLINCAVPVLPRMRCLPPFQVRAYCCGSSVTIFLVVAVRLRD